MPISPQLAHRIESDAKAPDYWSVPKGQAVNLENWPRIADHLRVLSEFQTTPWSEAQPKFAKALLDRKLIKPYNEDHKAGFSAVARMQFPVWRLLGLAWINAKNVPEVTNIGQLFVGAKSEAERRELLTMQLQRYQFHNPTIRPHFSTFRTFPILALYRLLTQTNWKLSWNEFQLFGTRIRTFSDADELAQLIEEWRTLAARERDNLLAVAHTVRATSHTKSEEGTTWEKVSDDLGYVGALLRILPTLDVTDRGIEVPSAARKRVQRTALASAKSAEFIEYASAQDWLALYGAGPEKDRWDTPWTTASEARSYYERVGKIEAATEAFAREEGRTARAISEYRSIQVVERVLEDVLEHNLDVLEKGLTLMGRQYPTAVGPIDLLARDAEGAFVVIELKRGRSGDRVVGQIARYLTWVVQRLSSGRESRVRGIVVGKDFDKNFAAAVTRLKRVSSYTFDLQVLCERWPPDGKERRRVAVD